MFAIIGAFLGMVATAVGVMTLVEGLGEGDYKKALFGGISAFAGYSTLQSSIASSAAASTAATEAAQSGALSTMTDAASTDLIMDKGVLSGLQEASTMNVPELTAATFSDAAATTTPSTFFDAAGFNAPTANIAGATSSTSTGATSKLLDTAPLEPGASNMDIIQPNQGVQAEKGVSGDKGSSAFDKASSFFSDFKTGFANLTPEEKNTIATLMGKGLEYQAAREQAALIKQQNDISMGVWNNQNSPVLYKR